MRQIEIIPSPRAKLFDQLQKKEAAIRESGRGTFYRTGRALKNSARWKHKAYPGSIALKRGVFDAVSAKVVARAKTGEWQLMSAFLGFVDRHFGEEIESISIRYR